MQFVPEVSVVPWPDYRCSVKLERDGRRVGTARLLRAAGRCSGRLCRRDKEGVSQTTSNCLRLYVIMYMKLLIGGFLHA